MVGAIGTKWTILNKERNVMRRPTQCSRFSIPFLPILFVVAACTAPAPSYTSGGNMQSGQAAQDQIAHGRALVVSHACGDCHGGGSDPAAFGWLDGVRGPIPDQQVVKIGSATTRA